MKSNRGFSIVEIVVVVVVVAIIGAAAYLFLNNPADESAANPANDTTPSNYETNADLDTAMQELDSTDIDASLDASLEDLDQEVAEF